MAEEDDWENKDLDDWESRQVDDWETEDFNPTIQKKTVSGDNKASLHTIKVLQSCKKEGEGEGEGEGEDEDGFDSVIQLDDNKFEGEDEEDDDIVESWEEATPKPQPKKKEQKKYDESRGQVQTHTDVPLDDPVAEKQRLQRLIEEQDYKATQELFGTNNSVAQTTNPLDSMIPKSEKDFEDYAAKLVELYISPHQKHKQYKKLLKEIMKLALEPGTKDLAKEIEQSISAIKSRKIKQENEEKQKQKASSKKVTLNVGAKGGQAGLDDYQYEDIIDDDDFM